MIADKPLYRVFITEDVRLIKEVYVSAWSEKDARDYINELYDQGDEGVECTMDDFEEVTYRDVYVQPETNRKVVADYDTGLMPPEAQ